ncbi:MAG: carbohydrate binding domain-containing protein [Chloroflexota bacterium]|nr:carbohydrate binding domain-containing protein [Chloroflexota bacterium]
MKHPHYSHSHSVAVCSRRCGATHILYILLALLLAANCPAIAQAQAPIRVIFLHHSCGENLIEQGQVRPGLTALGHEFYDHGYNSDGLRLADGSYTGANFDVPGDNTDPDGFAEIFAQPLHDPPDNTFSHLMQYDVIAFKSCSPTSNIWGDEHLAEYKSYYLAIRDRMDQHPDKIFIVVTQPPQVPGSSDPEEATRARAFASWLQSDEYLAGHPNVFTFDFFGLLAGDDNFLRADYRYDDYDGHPNERANRAIGPLFVEFIDQAIVSYGTEVERPTSAAPTSSPPEVTQPPASAVPPSTDGILEDLESAAGYWEADSETGSTIECGSDTEITYGGAASLRINYSIRPDGWGDCGRYFEEAQDWSGGTGISLWLHADSPIQGATLILMSGDGDAPTPFELDFTNTRESVEGWAQVVFPWTDFARAGWADEGGLSELNPAQVWGYALSFGAGAATNEGVLWVDDIGLASGEEQPPAPATSPTAAPAPVEEPAEEPIAEPVGEEEPGGGICPGTALALPLSALGMLLSSHRRRSLVAASQKLTPWSYASRNKLAISFIQVRLSRPTSPARACPFQQTDAKPIVLFYQNYG